MAMGDKLDDATRTELIGNLVRAIREAGRTPQTECCKQGQHEACDGVLIPRQPYRCEFACHGSAEVESGN